ncbi:L-threonine 3-dehydrogenase [Actinomyces bowdenii]|uniref:L-threonine 3-dehydrogenase n=1 Tax=Actinomyces bowdenii TaxID=131109 RepID=A0A3P1V7L7_9ACTO|nr:L-threonine 3-dehydrogenase [Actinomyces bowdenii]RRD30129.1 L-threonine 3-dehydrogenase [Actinomyces bowdenii]
MRALRKPAPGPGLELQDIPRPGPGFREVLIRVMRTGLCGTDLHLAGWDDFAAAQLRPPMTLGHEFYGEIVELGAGVATEETTDEGDGDVLHLGQRVSVEGHITCGRCRNCRAGRRHLCIRTSSIGVNRDGAFADYVVVPARNVWPQDPLIDPDLGALFDPLGNAVHTALQSPLSGEDVLVTGAGPIGIMCAAIARHCGARNVVITDPSDYRLALAATTGAVTVNTADQDLRGVMAGLGMTEGFDVGMEVSGAAPAMRQMIEVCNHGAQIAMLGLPKAGYEIDWNQVITRMLTIKGVYGREMFDTWYKASFMLGSSQELREAVRGVITHRFTPEQWADAFEAARSGQCGKVIITWD